MIELPGHPWFVGCQFHPEFTSTPRAGHPLFKAFVQAALDDAQAGAGEPATRRPRPSALQKHRRTAMKLCGFEVGLDRPLFLIAGPCVVESRQLAFDTAGELKEIAPALGIPFIYKSSYDKANRSSIKSFRGLGMDKGSRSWTRCASEIGVPVLTDVHEIEEIERGRGRGGRAADAGVPVPPDRFHLRRRRAPASRSTSRRASSSRPGDMKNVVEKRETRARARPRQRALMVCERGASFGYNNLVSDMRSLAIMREPAARSCSMRRIRCSCRAGRAPRAAGSASSCRCWRARRWRAASRACSWRRTRTRRRRSPTARTRGRSST